MNSQVSETVEHVISCNEYVSERKDMMEKKKRLRITELKNIVVLVDWAEDAGSAT